MAVTVGTIRKSRRRGRFAGLIVLSLLAHAGLLGVVGLHVSRLRFDALPIEPALDIWLTPNLTRNPQKPEFGRLPEAKSRPAPSASGSSREQPRAVSPSPNVVTAPSAASGPPAAPAEAANGLQGALRTRIGCDADPVVHLTAEERDRCNQHYAEIAKRGPAFVDVIPPEKRAYYDAVQAAYQAMNDARTPVSTGVGGQYQAWGRLPGLGCGMKFGGPPQPPDHRSFSDKVKATGMIAVPIGPISCGVVLPKGSWTPEIGIPTP